MEVNGLKIEFNEGDLANCAHLCGDVEMPVYGYAYKKIHLYKDEESDEVISKPVKFELKNILGFRESKGSLIGTELNKDRWCVMGYIDPDTHKIFEYAVDSTYGAMVAWWTKIESYKRAISEVILTHELQIVKEIKEKIALMNKWRTFRNISRGD